MKLIRRRLALMMTLWLAALTGCGGSHSAAPPARGVGTAHCTILWPAQGKLIPSAAHSIKLSLTRGETLLEQRTVDRPADGAPSAETFTELPPGALFLSAAAFPQTGAGGVAQAAGTVPLVIVAGADTPITLTLASTVASWAITTTPVPTVVGHAVSLVASALDAQGHTVLVPAATWQVTSGAGVVTVTSPGAGGGQTASVACVTSGVATIVAKSQQQDGLNGSELESAPVTIQSVGLPTIAAEATPTAAKVTQPFALTATATVDSALGRVASYDWDLDGDGTYERPGLDTPSITATYTAAATVHPRVRVTDNFGSTATDTLTVTVNPADVPTVTLTPSDAGPTIADMVSFTAAATVDPDVGHVVGYDWDLDGDGIFETLGATASVKTHSYSAPGSVSPAVRVHDNFGATALAHGPLTVTGSDVDVVVTRREGRHAR